jgi:hypothetical protein
VDPTFYNFFKIQVKVNKAYPAFNELINTFREIQREASATKSASHGAFAASFQGVTQEVGKENKKTEPKKKHKPCLCGDEHRFKDCPYLVEAKRLSNWMPDKVLKKVIEEKIRASPKLQAIIGKLRNEKKKEKSKSLVEEEDKSPASFFAASHVTDIAAAYSTSSDNTIHPYHLRDWTAVRRQEYGFPFLTKPKDYYTNCLRQLVSRTTTYTHNLYCQPALTISPL